MDISARHVAVLAFGALLPFSAFALGSGEITPVIAVVSVVDILIVAISIAFMFGPVSGPDQTSATVG